MKIGGVYQMNHSRRGTATVKILSIEGEWINVEILKGSLKGIGAGSLRGVGDELTVRETLTNFTVIYEDEQHPQLPNDAIDLRIIRYRVYHGLPLTMAQQRYLVNCTGVPLAHKRKRCESCGNDGCAECEGV